MPRCLTREEIYSIISRELPEKTYAFSTRPEDFYTTSDDDSTAKAIESFYSNMCRIYNNQFPQTADEYIGKWEIKVFGEIGQATSGLVARKDRVLTKIRSRKGIRPIDIKEIVLLVIGSDKIIEIIENQGSDGSWILDVSELDVSTILNEFNGSSVLLSGPDIWEKSASELGLSEEELAEYKSLAYGYTVKIINYEATEDELAEIDRLLTMYEPARSWHTIQNNATLEDAETEWLLDFSELGENTYL